MCTIPTESLVSMWFLLCSSFYIRLLLISNKCTFCATIKNCVKLDRPVFFYFYKVPVIVKFCFYIPVSAGVLINFFLPTCIISNSKPFCSSCYFTFYTFLLFRLLFVVLIQFLNLVIIQNQVSYLLGHFYYLDFLYLFVLCCNFFLVH